MCETTPTTHFPTKAARKHFEINSTAPSSSITLTAPGGHSERGSESDYLKTSPPDLKDAVVRVKNRTNSQPSTHVTGHSTKKVRKNVKNHSEYMETSRDADSMFKSSGAYCSQSGTTLIPLSWVPSTTPGADAIRMINCFLNYDPGQSNAPRSPPLSSSSLSSPYPPSTFYCPPSSHPSSSSSSVDAVENGLKEKKDFTDTVIFQCPVPVSSSSFFQKDTSSSPPSSSAYSSTNHHASSQEPSQSSPRSQFVPQFPSFEPSSANAPHIFQGPPMNNPYSVLEVSITIGSL